MREVYVRVHCKSKWLACCSSKPEYKEKIRTEAQYIFKVRLLCSGNFGDVVDVDEEKPELEVSFINDKSKVSTSQKIALPIYINKIC